jgi:hypothetical protein
MSENVGRTSSPAAPSRRTLMAPAAPLARVRKVELVAPASRRFVPSGNGTAQLGATGV